MCLIFYDSDLILYLSFFGFLKALREEEKMRKRVNTRLPKEVEDISKCTFTKGFSWTPFADLLCTKRNLETNNETGKP